MGEAREAESPADEKSPENRERAERILDAAMKLITHYGYDKTTVSDIAQEAGVSKGAIYLHWSSKDDLFEALLLREIRQYTEEWFTFIEADPKGGTLPVMIRVALTILKKRPLLLALFSRDKRVLGDFMRRQDPEFYSKRLSYSHEFIALMQQAGVVRKELDPAVVAYLLTCINYGFVMVDDALAPSQIPPIALIMQGIEMLMERALSPEAGANNEAGKQIMRQMLAQVKQQWDKGKLM
jgi:TetR/AcrR family acrAB operon transcriptional repressor